MRLFTLLILSALIGLWTPLAKAFDQDHCGDLFPKVDDKYPPYYSPLYTFTMFPSTTSYVSSWGKCSLYGDNRQLERNRFVAAEYERISREAAQGGGEYVAALASLSGCPESEKEKFSQALQSQFGQVFTNSRGEKAEIVSGRIDAVISGHSELSKNCIL